MEWKPKSTQLDSKIFTYPLQPVYCLLLEPLFGILARHRKKISHFSTSFVEICSKGQQKNNHKYFVGEGGLKVPLDQNCCFRFPLFIYTIDFVQTICDLWCYFSFKINNLVQTSEIQRKYKKITDHEADDKIVSNRMLLERFY